ncbi:DNA-binding response regulator in two-component regulatory system with KdpD [uncultured delta proteobacterium]|uniref:DNA-binding response regulator in two-component regulatory system with KdpD n=1 Tax=uncultured delta proteobacterium TaxID=34034 RepID=A0A212JB88_9DELT|nr:DNA-binding response regulator in two-component regulatory system with KdpD [uncultured delta proteobacterium]
MKANILVVEDDSAVRSLITTALTTFGYKVGYAGNGAEAISEAVSLQPDLFILDLGLPDMDGADIIAKLRTWTNNPIIVVSARTEIHDKIAALDAGADDYLAKPFSVEELMARVRAALRKMSYDNSPQKNTNVFVNGGLCIDYAANAVFVDDVEIHLTPMEYKLLCLLSRNAGKVLTHNYILKEIWASDFESTTQSLRVFMASLRKKIEKNQAEPVFLKTHLGVGYRMVRVQDDAP